MEIIQQQILDLVPQKDPFRFVDELVYFDKSGIKGTYTFKEDLPFFKGHFPDFPVVPGVLLTECMAQIGGVCLGIYLSILSGETDQNPMLLTESNSIFYKPVFPGDTFTAESKLIYFRFGKLKVEVKGYNQKGELVCSNVHSGIITKRILS